VGQAYGGGRGKILSIGFLKMTPAMTADLMIDPATPEDLDRLLQIAQESFSSPWTRKMFQAELTGNQFSRFIVARMSSSEGEPGMARAVIGYLCFWLVFEELRLMDLAVAPAARRRGVARALVSHALRVGRESGASRAILEVRASNQAAQSLYEHFGFRSMARRVNYYSSPTEDAVLMESALGANS
jgi:ribosomal-protein-alanine N-acetyltransferase